MLRGDNSGEGGQGCGRTWYFTEVVVKPSLETRTYERRPERGSQVAEVKNLPANPGDSGVG